MMLVASSYSTMKRRDEELRSGTSNYVITKKVLKKRPLSGYIVLQAGIEELKARRGSTWTCKYMK